MKRIGVHTEKEYEILIGRGLLKDAGALISSVITGKKAMVVSDDNVFPLYGPALEQSLREAGFSVSHFVFPHGEEQKNLTVYGDLLEAMCREGMSRSDAAVALGGGVVGDLCGFAAATYQRGCGLVQIPTTLLAAVDSSVGGKTAIDLKNGKNQAGCFYQPYLVLTDPDTLETLPEAEYRNGCAEIIKYAMIEEGDFFGMLSGTPICEQYDAVIARCVEIKRKLVEEDEFDKGVRMFLNFGHTFGHGVEAASGFAVPHGQAVAMGMAAVTRAAAARKICSEETADRLTRLLIQYGLPTELPYSSEELKESVLVDKKNTSGAVRLVVPEAIGKCRILPVAKNEISDWLSAGGAR